MLSRDSVTVTVTARLARCLPGSLSLTRILRLAVCQPPGLLVPGGPAPPPAVSATLCPGCLALPAALAGPGLGPARGPAPGAVAGSRRRGARRGVPLTSAPPLAPGPPRVRRTRTRPGEVGGGPWSSPAARLPGPTRSLLGSAGYGRTSELATARDLGDWGQSPRRGPPPRSPVRSPDPVHRRCPPSRSPVPVPRPRRPTPLSPVAVLRRSSPSLSPVEASDCRAPTPRPARPSVRERRGGG